MTPRRECGFSLVEMVIVIALLGILTGVAMISLQAFDAGAREAATGVDAVSAAVACDAATNDLLMVAACAGPQAPPPPPVPSLAGTVTISTDDGGEDGASTAGEPLVLALGVSDVAGDALAGAFVRIEVFDSQDETGPQRSSDVAPATDVGGQSAFVVTREDAGFLTVRACIGASSAPPETCSSSTAGVSDLFVREFRLRPRVTHWDRDDSDSALRVSWDAAVTPVSPGSAARYLVYDSPQACASGQPPAAVGTVRSVLTSATATILRVDLSGSVLESGQMADRRLRIEADTEAMPASAGGFANRATACLPFGNVPVATTLTLSPGSGLGPTGSPATMTATLLDEAGRPFTGARVRYEIVSDAGSPTLVGTPPVTDQAGQTVFSFTRQAAATDMIRVCTQPNGAMPSSCATSTGPQATAMRTWTETTAPVVQPSLLDWKRVSNDTIQATWNTDVDRSPAPSSAAYRIYASPEDCAAGEPVAAVGSLREVVTGTGGTTVRIAFPSNVVQQVRLDQRRLSVTAETEQNTEGTGNDAVDCAAPEVAAATSLDVQPASGTTRTGEDLTLTATLTDSDGVPFAGASVRFEARGISELVLGPVTTDASGQASVAYRRDGPGADEIVACVDADGAAPTSCVAASGPTGTATRTWFTTPPQPTVVSWSRVNNRSIQVVWNTDVSTSDPAPSDYRMFDASGTCPGGTPLSGGSGVTRQVVAGTDGTTVLIGFGGNVAQQNFLDNRRLQIGAGAEGNVDGVGNDPSSCLATTP